MGRWSFQPRWLCRWFLLVTLALALSSSSIAESHAEVRSRLTTRGTVVSIDYRMLEQGSRWAVYDAVVDDMSVVANYRNQFESIIRTSSFAQLLDRMQRFSRAQARGPGDPEAEEQKVRVLAFLFGSAATRK